MANKKATADRLIAYYMDYVLSHGENPKSVYLFAKENNLKEEDFYDFYANFEELEKDIFNTFFHNTLGLLKKSEEYQLFDSKNKLISFYFTFFEMLTANRSYVVHALQGKKDKLKSLETLKKLRLSFKEYVKELQLDRLKIENERLSKIQDRSIEETAWIQLLITVKFWLDDTSPSFEKTDIFIEKSLQTSFELMDYKPLEKLIDFGKFILKEKVNMRV
ncbi:TetR family transcriptional regulator C-terminal domain-containing protein [Galbibacter mesophilus]|uniref:TetR family transcriptional regulator C-terminal domain-containing protein n=1 Tax=Galbibacter mesophilus TaxID=379069 RepID=UPI00191DFE36|nr:TetR family transcriptional regulator C-terminal domain-containing protein [Galbibacter mesophilus]MCM5664101.1 TetR family transcriptional regulator C-terminal domain-containing protein [Galbibacter mesophilus]